jgi:DNA-binding GntR family transcriptional regulator
MPEDTLTQTVTLLPAEDSGMYVEILQRIKRGEIGADDRIVDSRLASEFNVSRMPVRQALLRLVHEGYLVGSTRGFVLPKLTHDDIEEIFELRMMLEPRAAASACRKLDDGDIAALRSALHDAQHAIAEGRIGDMMLANDRFRQIWLDAVPNRRLAAAISRFVDHVQMVRRVTMFDPVTQHLALDLLARLLDGFVERDAMQVHDATLQFVVRGRESFIGASVGAASSRGPAKRAAS